MVRGLRVPLAPNRPRPVLSPEEPGLGVMRPAAWPAIAAPNRATSSQRSATIFKKQRVVSAWRRLAVTPVQAFLRHRRLVSGALTPRLMRSRSAALRPSKLATIAVAACFLACSG